MNNKQVFGILIIFSFLAVSAYAKDKQQLLQALGAEAIVTKMKTQLELSDKQVDEVKSIVENYLAQEKKLKLEEAKELSKVLTGEQMFTWNFLQNEKQKEKKKKSPF